MPSSLTLRPEPLRVLFDKNMPVAVSRFLVGHKVCTILDMCWPSQIENGQLLLAAEAAGFDVMLTADQNIRYQQNLKGRELALVVLGSNIWPIVRLYAEEISLQVNSATPGSYAFIDMPLPLSRSYSQ